jgi:hypothetical protein
MSKYFDRHGVQLHKDDAVRLEGVGAALEHAEGVIHSFYLMRDGKDRARVHLTGQGGRAVGVKVELLTKIHDDGPEPVFDELVPHAAAISDVLGRRFVPPGGSRRTSAAGPFGEAVDALAAALLAAFTVLDDAVRRWPPPIESTSNGGALTPRAQEVKRTMDGLKAAPPKADAMHGVDKAAALVAPMKVLCETLLEGGEKIIDAFGCYLPVERNFLDVDADGSPAGGLARVSAGSVISNAFKSAPKMARIPQEAFRYRDEALARLYPARRCVPALRPLFYESGEALRRAHAALSTPVPPSLASRVGLHKPPRASAHAREERRGGYYFYVPDDWAGPSETLPLVVALHGKESNGPAFFWRLSREASSRRFALLAPSSLGLSWGTPPPNWALPDPKRPGANADVPSRPPTATNTRTTDAQRATCRVLSACVRACAACVCGVRVCVRVRRACAVVAGRQRTLVTRRHPRTLSDRRGTHARARILRGRPLCSATRPDRAHARRHHRRPRALRRRRVARRRPRQPPSQARRAAAARVLGARHARRPARLPARAPHRARARGGSGRRARVARD